MIEKKESRRIRKEIRQVLLKVWNPIGFSVPEGEYDCCIGGVFRLLTTGGTDGQIADYLQQQASEHIGLNVGGESMLPTVAALRQIPIKL